MKDTHEGSPKIWDMVYSIPEGHRRTNNEAEIRDFIGRVAEGKKEIIVWQTEGDTRLEQKAFFGPLNHDRQLRIWPTTEQYPANFNDEKSLYLYCEELEIAGICTIIYHDAKNMAIALPNALVKRETRLSKRINLFGDEKKVSLKKQRKSFEFTLIDISEDGLSMIVPQVSAANFKYRGDQILIDQLFGKKLAERVQGKLVYLKNVDSYRNRQFRVGVKFNKPIEIDALL